MNFDNLMPVLEFICIAISASISIGLAFNKWVFTRFGNRVFAWQLGFLVGAVVIGVAIRYRQWRRVCGFARRGSEKVNMVERIEKLEEDVRSSVTIVRVLSRQLEKLGVRFRVTRKALKDPIAEAAALAQKNSETTRALAAQEDILEKELSEIQKVLLAMQEQQQKQLELILAIGKTGKLWDTKRGPPQEQVQAAPEARKPTEERPHKIVNAHIQALDLQKEANDRA